MLRNGHLEIIFALIAFVGCLAATPDVYAQTGEPEESQHGIRILLKSSLAEPSNSPHPQFRLVNTGNTTLNLNALQLRYWFNCDCELPADTLSGYGDWAGILPYGEQVSHLLRGSFETASAGSQTHALHLGFAANSPSLVPGEFVEIHIRFSQDDWGYMLQSNDWSYAPDGSFTVSNRVTGYINGELVWGEEPY